MRFGSITPNELYERIRAGEAVDLIDVRSTKEYAAGHAVGARSVPLETVTKEAVVRGRRGTADGPVYVICWSGMRSQAACGRLVEDGLENVVNVEGGTKAWQEAGLPTEGSGGGAGRWVRAGGLAAAALSLVLGLTVHPGFAFAAVGIWLVMVLTGSAPCCGSGTCSTRGSG